MRRVIDCVVAADARGGIARGGDLPWHLPGDLKHFRDLTKSTGSSGRRNAVVMGRKTWETIPDRFRPLPGRLNVVLSRRGREGVAPVPEGVLVESSLSAALERLAEPPLATEIERVFCTGGAQIYARALELPECERIYLTRIEHDYQCDTFFPEFEPAYQLESVMSEAEENGVRYRIEVWKRR